MSKVASAITANKCEAIVRLHYTNPPTMKPVQDLLNRIKWDAEFSIGVFEIAYVDHSKEQLVRIPYKETYFESDDKFAFQTYNDDDKLISVPFHRIRKVYKNGSVIWERKTKQ